MSGSTFISYRQSDAGGHAGRLHDRLTQWLDADELFFDTNYIQPGDHLPQRLADGIDGAKIVLVLIGLDWLSEINYRVALPDTDFVRNAAAAKALQAALAHYAAAESTTKRNRVHRNRTQTLL